ncbi:hypothetical protein [Sphingomonas sp. dw_22]|uniref:hypothetical protein n=1 Tax=Sphingomonas sp. dw_22 TaxID=2721175 RepID=UPI001BD67FC5|nr:hypothetical protein [Sphingomonas sp. dw_22]
MTNVRARFEVIESLKLNQNSGFAQLETAAFHLRKSIEGIAFGCLVAMEQGLKEVPRDAKGQWNADNIFGRLKKRDQLVFPEAFRREDPPLDGDPQVKHHIVANKEANLSIEQVRDIYRRSHKWLHEWNPYVEKLGKELKQSTDDLLIDIQSIWNWIVQHMIGIGGHVFLGFLKDTDGQVRVVAAESMN